MLTESGVFTIRFFTIHSTGIAGLMIHGITDIHHGTHLTIVGDGDFHLTTVVGIRHIIAGVGDTRLITVTGAAHITAMAGDILTIIRGMDTVVTMAEAEAGMQTTTALITEKEDPPARM